ncbi:MAG: hypothetical protein IJQ99_02375 [Synergistaceae bacterium]|nr:hypothetical protein [Synergistaceae bacterium]
MRNKNLFSGAAGKTSDMGGARMFTTPNTIEVPPEYEIDIGEHGDFVTCSLDGRLWLFTDKIIALKWNPSAYNNSIKKYGKMEIVNSENINNESVVGRGFDWILTKQFIIQYSENEPYILKESHDKNSVEPDSIEKFYSTLPYIGDYEILPIGLLLNLSKEREKHLFSFQTVEFNYYLLDNKIEVSHPENIYLTYYTNKIFGRGSNRIGEIVILPHTFDENNNAENFYLYFTPKNIYSENKIDKNFNDIALSSITFNKKNDLYDFLYEKENSLQENLCLTSKTLKIFSPENNIWSIVNSHDGTMFFDTQNQGSIAIHKEGINIFDENNTFYECKTLMQYVTPANNMSSIIDDIYLSSLNNHNILATHLKKELEFYREFLINKRLPLTSKTYSNERLSLGVNKKRGTIEVNSIYSNKNYSKTINWNDIYKKPIEISAKEVNNFDANRYPPSIAFLLTRIYNYFEYLDLENQSAMLEWPLSVHGEGVYLDIDDATMKNFLYEFSLPAKTPKPVIWSPGETEMAYTYSKFADLEVNINNIIAVIHTWRNVDNIEPERDQTYDYSTEEAAEYWHAQGYNNWFIFSSSKSTLTEMNENWTEFDKISFQLTHVYNSYAYFYELSTGLEFVYKNSLLKDVGRINAIYNCSKRNTSIKNYRNRDKSLENAHVIFGSNKCIILYSQLLYDIFDFDAEIKRSALV